MCLCKLPYFRDVGLPFPNVAVYTQVEVHTKSLAYRGEEVFGSCCLLVLCYDLLPLLILASSSAPYAETLSCAHHPSHSSRHTALPLPLYLFSAG